jgi:NAD(P)-dependent dehydrogenase (short-subunit alcohol dehydrogenase family)
MTTTATSALNADRPLEGRIALVTGASRGLGAAIARAYAGAGAHVILLARTQGALEELDDQIQAAGGTATLFPFDLTESRKISAIGPAIAEKFGRLDILVGNAAQLGHLSPVAHSDPKVFEEIFRLNFFANYHLLRSLDPLLRGSDAGRAIFVTDAAAHIKSPFWGAYAAAKAALESMVVTYAAEVAHSPLRVNLVDPGAMRTEMRSAAFPAEDISRLPAPDDVAAAFIRLAAPGCAVTGRTERLNCAQDIACDAGTQ